MPAISSPGCARPRRPSRCSWAARRRWPSWATRRRTPAPGTCSPADRLTADWAAPLELGPKLRLGQSTVLTGTCSWTDPTLVKDTDWYPKKSMSAADRLAFYAAHFPIAEADSTYYFPPGPDLAKSWAERTPDGFTMNVKAYSLLTGHPTRPQSLWEDLRAAVEPVVAGTTPDLAVVRFHGRADATWNARVSSAAERFKYLYDGDELAEWAPRLAELADEADEVHALMNNCYQDYGVRNASDLQAV